MQTALPRGNGACAVCRSEAGDKINGIYGSGSIPRLNPNLTKAVTIADEQRRRTQITSRRALRRPRFSTDVNVLLVKHEEQFRQPHSVSGQITFLIVDRWPGDKELHFNRRGRFLPEISPLVEGGALRRGVVYARPARRGWVLYGPTASSVEERSEISTQGQ